jgi:hypothetical protein
MVEQVVIGLALDGAAVAAPRRADLHAIEPDGVRAIEAVTGLLSLTMRSTQVHWPAK